jgi:DNA-binding PadR family transcriptional regulator
VSGVDPRRFEAELRRGVVQLVALHYLTTPRYGYDLVRLLADAGFRIEEGTLYPILRRFEKQGVLTSRWDTEGKRPRKYYEISEEGRSTREAMMEAWHAARDATDQALRRSMQEDDAPEPGSAATQPKESE